MTITAAVISKSQTIPQQTLDSLSFVNEIIVVVDSDRIIQPITKDGVKYYFRPLCGDFADQRNFALSKASCQWVLFVDSDEYVSGELADEILQRTKMKTIKGYYIPRIDVVFHDALKHGETGNIKILRLAQRQAGRFARSVHERWIVSGVISDIESPLYHIKDHFVSEFSNRIALYGPSDAVELEHEHKPFSLFRLLVYPPAKFIQNYFIRLGIFDGTPGLFLAYLLAVQSLSVRIFQWTKGK